jgi:hypothetical protein
MTRTRLVPLAGIHPSPSSGRASLALMDDVLFEVNRAPVPGAQTKFPGLAERLLAKVK